MSENDKKPTLTCPCKNCVFAIYEKNTQVGCEANMTSKFKNVLKARDDEKEFDLIVGALCPYRREGDWPTSEQGLKKVREQTGMPYDAFVLCKQKKMSDLKKSINFLKKQSIKPQFVNFFIWPSVYYNDRVLHDLFTNSFRGTGIAWRFSRTFEEPSYELELVDSYYSDKTRLKYCYSVFQQGDDCGDSFFEKIRDSWVLGLQNKIVSVPDDKYNVYTVTKGAHIYFGKNVPEKAMELAETACTTHTEMFQ